MQFIHPRVCFDHHIVIIRAHVRTRTQMLVMGKGGGMAPVVPPELQQYMHYITADPAHQMMPPPLRPSAGQLQPAAGRQFQITHQAAAANNDNDPQRRRQSNVESDFLSQMQNLHPSDQSPHHHNFLRPPRLQLFTPVS